MQLCQLYTKVRQRRLKCPCCPLPINQTVDNSQRPSFVTICYKLLQFINNLVLDKQAQSPKRQYNTAMP